MTCALCTRPATTLIAWSTPANGGAAGKTPVCERHAETLTTEYLRAGFSATVTA